MKKIGDEQKQSKLCEALEEQEQAQMQKVRHKQGEHKTNTT
jgi:hypothetical protein